MLCSESGSDGPESSFAPNLKLNDQLNYRLWPGHECELILCRGICVRSLSLYRIASPLCEATKIFILTHISADALYFECRV